MISVLLNIEIQKLMIRFPEKARNEIKNILQGAEEMNSYSNT